MIKCLDRLTPSRYDDRCLKSFRCIGGRLVASGNRTEANGQVAEVLVKRSSEGMAHQTICPGRPPETSLSVRRRRMKGEPFSGDGSPGRDEFLSLVKRARAALGHRRFSSSDCGRQEESHPMSGSVRGRRPVRLAVCGPAVCGWLRSDSRV